MLRFLATKHVYREGSSTSRLAQLAENDSRSSATERVRQQQTQCQAPYQRPRLVQRRRVVRCQVFLGIRLLLTCCSTDELFKATTSTWETLSDPEYGQSYDPSRSAFRKVHGAPLFEFYEQYVRLQFNMRRRPRKLITTYALGNEARG